jgi:hypothetical protein
MKKVSAMVVIFLGMIVLAACNINNNSNTNPEQGYFLVANISPDAPPLSMSINSSSFLTNLAYGAYTPYYGAAGGTYNFSIYGITTSPVLNNTVTISTNTLYSYFLIDSFNTITSAFVTDKIPATSTDSAYVRFFNFSPNVGAVSLRDSAAGTNLFLKRTFNDQQTNTSLANFTRLKAGNYDFQLNLSDSTLQGGKSFSLTGGHVYTLFAKGFKDGTGDAALGIGQIMNY